MDDGIDLYVSYYGVSMYEIFCLSILFVGNEISLHVLNFEFLDYFNTCFIPLRLMSLLSVSGISVKTTSCLFVVL
jgi:hypothetical protein